MLGLYGRLLEWKLYYFGKSPIYTMEVENMYWIVLIGFTAALLYIMYSRRQKLYDSGQIIKRNLDYLKQMHYFTLENGDWERVWTALKDADYHKAASVARDSQKPLVHYNGVNWSAQLYKCESNSGKDRYGFQFLKWTERQGMIQYEAYMNTVLTSIEKTFLRLDPQTEVSTEYVSTKTKPQFF